MVNKGTLPTIKRKSVFQLYRHDFYQCTHIEGNSSLRFRSIIGLGVCCMLFSRSPCSKNSEACNKFMYSYYLSSNGTLTYHHLCYTLLNTPGFANCREVACSHQHCSNKITLLLVCPIFFSCSHEFGKLVFFSVTFTLTLLVKNM